MGSAGPPPGSSRAEWAAPDLDREASERGGKRRTSAARKKIPKDMSERVSEEMPERMSEDTSEDRPESKKNRMSKNMSDKNVRRYARKKECDKICQKIRKKECQKKCQIERRFQAYAGIMSRGSYRISYASAQLLRGRRNNTFQAST